MDFHDLKCVGKLIGRIFQNDWSQLNAISAKNKILNANNLYRYQSQNSHGNFVSGSKVLRQFGLVLITDLEVDYLRSQSISRR